MEGRRRSRGRNTRKLNGRCSGSVVGRSSAEPGGVVWRGVGWVGVGVCYAIFRGASSEGVGLQAVEEEQTDGTRTQEGARQSGGRQMPRRVRATCSSMIL